MSDLSKKQADYLGNALEDGQGTSIGYPIANNLDPLEIESFLNKYFETYGSSENEDPYYSCREGEILNKASSEVKNISNDSMRNYLVQLLTSLHKILKKARSMSDFNNNIPPLFFQKVNDGSILLEWIFKDFRIGFSIEEDVEQSNWYLVSSVNLNELSESGTLDPKNFEAILSNLVLFVIRNT